MLSGMILIWSGAIVDIPVGYHLCDGGAGTPDLRNQFLVGAGDTYAVADNGGNINHNHDFTGDGHNHDLQGSLIIQANGDIPAEISTEAVTGTTDNQDGRPPYYALAYIMKL